MPDAWFAAAAAEPAGTTASYIYRSGDAGRSWDV
jgi:hypothetical protein